MVSCASVVNAQAPTIHDRPDNAVFRVQAWGVIAADFSERVSNYVELRSSLEKGLPVLTVTDHPGEILMAQRALAKRIRVARTGARQGDIFTSTISAEFRNVLLVETSPTTMAAIMNDNPGDVSRRINRAYPTGKPLASMPAGILAVLPRLPDDFQYRFLGRALILIDTRTNLILDRMPCAIGCAARVPALAGRGANAATKSHRRLRVVHGRCGRGPVRGDTLRRRTTLFTTEQTHNVCVPRMVLLGVYRSGDHVRKPY